MVKPNPWSDAGGPAPRLLMVGRYLVGAAERSAFLDDARAAMAVLAEQPGYVSGGVGQSTDDASLLTVTTLWRDAGAYRRALSSFEVKTAAVPLLSRAVDEPTAYELVHERSLDGAVDAVTGLVVDESGADSVVGARVIGEDR